MALFAPALCCVQLPLRGCAREQLSPGRSCCVSSLPPTAAPSRALPRRWSRQLPAHTRVTFPCVNSSAPSYPRNVTLAAVQLGMAMACVPASQLQLPPAGGSGVADALGLALASAHQAVTFTSSLLVWELTWGSLSCPLRHGLINLFLKLCLTKCGVKLDLAVMMRVSELCWECSKVRVCGRAGIQRAQQLLGAVEQL